MLIKYQSTIILMIKMSKIDINLKKRALELHEQNYKTADIVSTLNISRKSLFGILRRDRECFSQCDKPGSGRPVLRNDQCLENAQKSA